MSFRDYYYSQHPEQKIISDVISEMSMKIPDIPNNLRNKEENCYITKEVKEDGKFLEKFNWFGTELDVYEYAFSKRDLEVFFIHGPLTASKIQFSEWEDGIIIESAMSMGGYFSRIVPDIYVNYYLNKYKFILSDNAQTESGFGIYRYILSNREKYNVNVFIYNVKTTEKVEIFDIKELLKYFGTEIEFLKYRFLLEKNK